MYCNNTAKIITDIQKLRLTLWQNNTKWNIRFDQTRLLFFGNPRWHSINSAQFIAWREMVIICKYQMSLFDVFYHVATKLYDTASGTTSPEKNLKIEFEWFYFYYMILFNISFIMILCLKSTIYSYLPLKVKGLSTNVRPFRMDSILFIDSVSTAVDFCSVPWTSEKTG